MGLGRLAPATWASWVAEGAGQCCVAQGKRQDPLGEIGHRSFCTRTQKHPNLHEAQCSRGKTDKTKRTNNQTHGEELLCFCVDGKESQSGMPLAAY